MTLPTVFETIPKIQFQPRVLLSILALVLSIWASIEIADETLEGEFQSFDEQALLAFRENGDPTDSAGPPYLQEMMRDITALGSTTVLGFAILITTLFLILGRQRKMAALVFSSVLIGWGASHLLKVFLGRPRPSPELHLVSVSTLSFPSGHAMMSAVVYLTIATLISRILPTRKMKLSCLGVAAVLVFLVGLSRVYLGVHYPTDVLAGWTMGLSWALLSYWISRFLRVTNVPRTE